MSNQHEETYWTLRQVLNWIICRKPENLDPWMFTALDQVEAGLPEREQLPPLEIDGARPGEAEHATYDPKTGQVTEWCATKPLPVDDIVDKAEDALINILQKGTMKVIVRSVGADLHEEANARLWVKPHFTDRQGVRIRSTEFEDLRFLADEVKRVWPEDSKGLLAEYILVDDPKIGPPGPGGAQLETLGHQSPKQLDTAARSKGGRRSKYDDGLQEFINYVRDQLGT